MSSQTDQYKLHFKVGDRQQQDYNTNTQVGHTTTTDIAIPFQQLLSEIVTFVHFHEPEYHVLDVSQKRVCVTLMSKSDNTEFTYIGSSTNSIEDSPELAPLTAIHVFIQKFKLIIEDYTYHHEQETERCCRIYRLKRIELEQIAQRTPLTVLEENVSSSPRVIYTYT